MLCSGKVPRTWPLLSSLELFVAARQNESHNSIDSLNSDQKEETPNFDKINLYICYFLDSHAVKVLTPNSLVQIENQWTGISYVRRNVKQKHKRQFHAHCCGWCALWTIASAFNGFIQLNCYNCPHWRLCSNRWVRATKTKYRGSNSVVEKINSSRCNILWIIKIESNSW